MNELALAGVKWIASNWLSIISIVIGVGVSWHYYRKSERTVALSHTSTDAILMSPAHEPDDRLRITWEGIDVPRVTKTSVAVWNSGTDTIRGDSLIESDPLRITVPDDAQLLRANLLTRTRDVTEAQIVAIGNHAAVIQFKFLDANDGLSVEILHTGDSGQISVEGTVVGIPLGVSQLDRNKWDRRIGIGVGVVFVPVILAVLLMVMAIPFGFAYLAYASSWPKNLLYVVCDALLLWFVYDMFRDNKKSERPYRIAGVPDSLARGLGRSITQMQIFGHTANRQNHLDDGKNDLLPVESQRRDAS